MPLRMLRYYPDIALEHTAEKVVQYLLYIGKAPLTMPSQVLGHDWLYRYSVLDMRSQNSEDFLKSNNPDALVLAILCDFKGLEPDTLVGQIIKKLKLLHGPRLNNLRDSLKMLDVLASNRDLQNVVKENAEMLIDVEKLGIYQLVKEKGEAKGMEKGRAEGLEQGLEQGHQEIVLRLLAKLPPEQVADLSGLPLAKVKAIATLGCSL